CSANQAAIDNECVAGHIACLSTDQIKDGMCDIPCAAHTSHGNLPVSVSNKTLVIPASIFVGQPSHQRRVHQSGDHAIQTDSAPGINDCTRFCHLYQRGLGRCVAHLVLADMAQTSHRCNIDHGSRTGTL